MTPEQRHDLVADGMFTLPQAVEFSRVPRSTLYEWMTRGALPYVKIGRRRYIPRNALIGLVEKHLVTGE